MNVCPEYIFSGCWMPDDFRERINYLFPTCNVWEIALIMQPQSTLAYIIPDFFILFFFYIFLDK